MSKAETLSKDQVLHLAKLARLELTPEEVAHYTEQLAEVLGYVAKLQDVQVDGKVVSTVEPVTLRTDEVQPWPEPESLIKQAPKNHHNLVEVPAVFGERE